MNPGHNKHEQFNQIILYVVVINHISNLIASINYGRFNGSL